MMSESLLNGFLIFSVFQAILFAFLLISKKDNAIADKLLAAFLFIFNLQCIFIFLNINHPSISVIQLIPIAITLLYGPLLFLYIQSFKVNKPLKHIRFLYHGIPFIIAIIASVFLHEVIITKYLIIISSLLSGTIYTVLSIIFLRKHKKAIQDQYSYIEKINLNWLNSFVKIIALIWIGVLILVPLTRFINLNIDLNWFFISIPVLISYLGYHGIKQQIILLQSITIPQADNTNSEISTNNNHYSSEQIDDSKSNPDSISQQNKSYQKSTLDDKMMEMIHSRLIKAMEENQIFLRPALSLQELAEHINIQNHHITQTLNTYSGKNFYDFVNHYRVDEFKRQIEKKGSEQYSLLGIALDCGFNSKSSFNRIFKKQTGLSPTEYLKQKF
jgi:AraC-like DNA-binding protein